MNEETELLKAYRESLRSQQRAWLAMVIRVDGSAYRRPGAKMLITDDGTLCGAVSGGCLERDLIRRARVGGTSSRPFIVRYSTRADADDEVAERLIENPGLGCEGTIDILVNPNPLDHFKALEEMLRGGAPIEFRCPLPDGRFYVDLLLPPQPLFIFGAGHDVLPIARIGTELGWKIIVVDTRSSVPPPPNLFAGAHLIKAEAANCVLGLSLSTKSMAVVMTHNYEHDRAIIKQLFTTPLNYLGLLGPKARSERLLSEVGPPPSGLRLHYPVGLDLGGETPQSIALSILAEAQAVLSSRSGGFLKNRNAPIHSDAAKS